MVMPWVYPPLSPRAAYACIEVRGYLCCSSCTLPVTSCFGPADDPASNYVQLQHEYLHFLVDPLVEKYGGTINAKNADQGGAVFRIELPLTNKVLEQGE